MLDDGGYSGIVVAVGVIFVSDIVLIPFVQFCYLCINDIVSGHGKLKCLDESVKLAVILMQVYLSLFQQCSEIIFLCMELVTEMFYSIICYCS